jgi:3-oxoacyl-[acyl-carrier-protein] synthase II
MEAFLCGIGWVTGAGLGWGRQGDEFRLCDLPLPTLERKDVFPKPNQRFGRMSDYAKTGVAAVAFALRDAGLEEWEAKRAVGVVASTRLGCLATDVDYHRTVLLEGGGLASPNLFAYTLANCFLGDAAIQFGLTGSSVAINESCDGLGAVRMAMEDIAMGEAETMLAGICDLPGQEPYDRDLVTQTGAVFLVLSSAPGVAWNSYGCVTLTDDGRILFRGAEVERIVDLAQAALRCSGK